MHTYPPESTQATQQHRVELGRREPQREHAFHTRQHVLEPVVPGDVGGACAGGPAP